MNHPDPVSAQDVATKAYIDAAIVPGGSVTEITLNSVTGDQGTIDISTLRCGGAVNINPTGPYTIQGFTSKSEGFWFFLGAGSGSNPGTLVNESTAIATTTDRMRLAHGVSASADNLMAILYYRENRWRVVTGALPMAAGDTVTASGTQNALVLGDDAVRVQTSGNLVLNGMVAKYSGQIIDVHTGASHTLTINHLSASAAAADQIALPNAFNYGPVSRGGARFIYSGVWRCVALGGLSDGEVTPAKLSSAGNVAGDQFVHNGTIWTVKPASVGGGDFGIGVVSANLSVQQSAAGSTAVVAASGGVYTIPVASLRVGSTYRFVALYNMGGGASSPAVTATLNVGGTQAGQCFSAASATPGAAGRFEAFLRVQTLSASGSLAWSIHGDSRLNLTNTAVGTITRNTTADLTIEFTLNQATVVAGNQLNVYHGFVERIF